MSFENIKKIMTVENRIKKDFDLEVNRYLKEGWILINLGTSVRGSSSHENYYATMGKIGETEKEMI